MPRLTPAREEEIRRRILKAARQVYIEKGLNRASIDDVVAASGMSVGAIYNYFPNKEELIRACLDVAIREETNAVAEDMQTAATVAERMERAMKGWWRYTMELPGGPAFLAEALAEASRRPMVREVMAARFERAATVASMFMRQGIASGELPAGIDVDSVARTFAAMLDGLILEYVVSGGTLRLPDALKSVQLVLQGAIAASGPAPASDR